MAFLRRSQKGKGRKYRDTKKGKIWISKKGEHWERWGYQKGNGRKDLDPPKKKNNIIRHTERGKIWILKKGNNKKDKRGIPKRESYTSRNNAIHYRQAPKIRLRSCLLQETPNGVFLNNAPCFLKTKSLLGCKQKENNSTLLPEQKR